MDAAVVIDYQNLHLTGASLFYRDEPLHHHLVDPGLFAEALTRVRNARQGSGYSAIEITRIEVFRGLPSSKFDSKAYNRNQAQKSVWERDSRVHVTLRPLQYPTRWDGVQKVQNGPAREKGIDVLCALAMVRLASTHDVVVLASQDTDLEPALDAAMDVHRAKVEASVWNDGRQFPASCGPPIPRDVSGRPTSTK